MGDELERNLAAGRLLSVHNCLLPPSPHHTHLGHMILPYSNHIELGQETHFGQRNLEGHDICHLQAEASSGHDMALGPLSCAIGHGTSEPQRGAAPSSGSQKGKTHEAQLHSAKPSQVQGQLIVLM